MKLFSTFLAGTVALDAKERNGEFDCHSYLARFPDLMNAFGSNCGQAYDHFLQNGKREGRSAVYTGQAFDCQGYLSRYPDLSKAFGSSCTSAFNHYVRVGRHEGRDASENQEEFKCETYLVRHPDLMNAFGSNCEAAFSHYLQSGLSENRDASGDVDVWHCDSYLAKHRDLQLAFGNNCEKAFNHYVNIGRHEGRDATHVDIRVTEPVEVQLVIEETPETFTESKQVALREEIASDLGLNTDDVTITIFQASRRLITADTTTMMIVVTINILPTEAASTIAVLESPAFTEATGATFLDLEPTAGASEAFVNAVKTDIVVGEQKKALKAIGIESDREYSPSAARSCCISSCATDDCKKGCKHWVHSSSLNWISANQEKLLRACKTHCTKAAKHHELFSVTRVAANEEASCHDGCEKFELCSY